VTEASEVLSMFLEAGVAFLGFGALVSLFGKSTDSYEAALASARLRCMLELNLAIPVLAVSPFVLRAWIGDELMLWRTMCIGTLALACFLTALGLALMISGAFFALVTSIAFKLARQRRPQVGTSRMDGVGTR